MLARYDEACKNYATTIEVDKIKTIIPDELMTLYPVICKSDSALCKHICDTFITASSKQIRGNELYDNRNNISNHYWHVGFNALLANGKMETLPDKLKEFGIMVYKGVARDEITFPLHEYVSKVISKLETADVVSHSIDIINDYCNGQRNINTNSFAFYEESFRQQKLAIDRAAEYVHKIVEPVFGDKKCRDLILTNAKEYVKLITKAGEASNPLKEMIRKEVSSSDDERLISFASGLGIEK